MPITPLCFDGSAVKPGESLTTAIGLRCKRWSCDYCRELNRRRVIAIAANSGAQRMLTLTVSSTQYPEIEQAAAALKRGLRLLRLSLKRHNKHTNFEFMAVFEKHQSGHPHLHLLIKGQYVPWRWLKYRWQAITGSSHVDIRRIKGKKRAAQYVAKYLGKDLEAFAGCKRWWRSHGFIEKPATDDAGKISPSNWHLARIAFDDLIEAFAEACWNVQIERNRTAQLTPSSSDTDDPADVIAIKQRNIQRRNVAKGAACAAASC